jgi:UDP-N-acetylmuramoyl-tripeptide--D-alanyl-D-alanine ligase
MNLLIFFAALFFGAKRLARYLRYLQQEGYDTKRFFDWFWQKKSFDRKGSFVVACTYWVPFLPAVLLLGLAAWEENPLKTGKIPLQLTNRAKRIFGCALFLYSLLLLSIFHSFLWLIVLFQAIPLILAASVWILELDERRRQKKIIKQAKDHILQVNPFIIGITGSAGKTSTKAALGQILSITKGATFWPDKGINTPMGIARSIREGLKPLHQFAVIEMGAYNKGSIARLAGQYPPQAAIITDVGTCHLERFGSREIIRKTKKELAEALPKGAFLVLNGDNPFVRQIGEEESDKNVIYYGFKENNDLVIKPMGSEPKGTHFYFCWKGESYQGFTPQLGNYSLLNLAGAFVMAVSLGANPRFAMAALATIKPVSHRLEYQKQNGISYLNDSYNSNPQGFCGALDVLKELPAKRRLLVTPGMIELGSEQIEQNQSIGKKAARICDFALIVNEINQKALHKGLRVGGMKEENIIFCCTRDDAFSVLKSLALPEDLILIENDLPDIYEVEPKW